MQVVPAVWSDVFAVDDVSEGKDEMSAQLDVDVFRRETRVTGPLM